MLMLVIVLASASVPRLVYASTSEIFDANDTTPAYLDIVHAKVTDRVGTGQISFMMELAEAVPNPPETGTFVAYNWQLDTDPSLAGIEFRTPVDARYPYRPSVDAMPRVRGSSTARVSAPGSRCVRLPTA